MLCFGCGVGGQPRPPRVERPEPVSDLAVTQKGPALDLSFTRPLRAVDGQRLTKPLEIEIFRATTKAGTSSTNPQSAVPLTTVSADELARHTSDDKVFLSQRLSDSEFSRDVGVILSFAVRGDTFGFRRRKLESELSNVVQVMLLDVSGAIENLHVKTTEQALAISWTPPERGLSGKLLSGLADYRVYRSGSGKPGSFELRGEPVRPEFSDRDFAFDRTYFYKVCARFKQGAQVAESEDSAVVEITPRDVFAPAAPKNLSGLFNAGAVQLVWSANTEADLAGYNVYRREGNGPWQKINPELLRTPTFEDRAVQMDRQYLYRVTALDLAHNESAPSEQAPVETQ